MMSGRLRRALAPWFERQRYERLTLAWTAAKQAYGAMQGGEPAVSVRAIERPELERLAQNPENEISRRFLEGLAPRDDLCVGGFIDGQLACYGFYSAAPPTDIDDGLRFHFPAQGLYVYKGFTHPAHRGKRLRTRVLLGGMPAIAQWRGAAAEPAGFVTLVLSYNQPSLKALRRIGFQPQQSFPVLKLRSRAFLRVRDDDRARGFFIEKIDPS
jgi:hypothetical protein